MKRTVFTLLFTALLTAAFCTSAFAQGTWTLHAELPRPTGVLMFWCTEFVDNNTIIIGTSVTSPSGEGRLYKWNFNSGTKQYESINSIVTELAIGGDTDYIMYGKMDGSVGSRWTSNLGWRAGITTGFVSGRPVELAYSDPRYGHEHLVVGGTSPGVKAQLQVWEVSTTNFQRLNVRTIDIRTAILDLETSKYVDEFFAADNDTNADLYRTNGSHKADFGHPASGEEIISLAFNWQTDADRLATGKDNDGGIRIYRYSDRQHLRTVNVGVNSDVEALDFSPTHWDILACVAGRGHIVIWDINGEGIFLSQNTSYDVGMDVAFSPNGNYLASVNSQRVRIWRNTGGLAAPSANPPPEKPPEVTTLLTNFPNPFNPETWIPYQLAKPAEVTVTIHAADGKLVRTLELGQMPAGVYQDKDRAAYWDGRNAVGERVASGVYFYTLKAGDFSATKKMLIRK